MNNIYWRSPRQRQNDEYNISRIRDAVVADWRAGLVATQAAVQQLQEAGLFNAEIEQALG